MPPEYLPWISQYITITTPTESRQRQSDQNQRTRFSELQSNPDPPGYPPQHLAYSIPQVGCSFHSSARIFAARWPVRSRGQMRRAPHRRSARRSRDGGTDTTTTLAPPRDLLAGGLGHAPRSCKIVRSNTQSHDRNHRCHPQLDPETALRSEIGSQRDAPGVPALRLFLRNLTVCVGGRQTREAGGQQLASYDNRVGMRAALEGVAEAFFFDARG